MRRLKTVPLDIEKQNAVVAMARAGRTEREQSYRGQAIAMYPPICARCGREYSGKSLRELTVHHKNHDHDCNPADGSNWELLCIYCHDNEHARHTVANATTAPVAGENKTPVSTYQPFAALQGLLKPKE